MIGLRPFPKQFFGCIHLKFLYRTFSYDPLCKILKIFFILRVSLIYKGDFRCYGRDVEYGRYLGDIVANYDFYFDLHTAISTSVTQGIGTIFDLRSYQPLSKPV